MGERFRARRRILAGALALAAWLALEVAVWWVPPPLRLMTPASTVVRYRDGQAAAVFLAPDDRWRFQGSLEHVDPDFVRALIAFEDERFWSHPGVDPLAVARATGQNLRAGRVVSGASTLTMQLVRVLEPRPRTLHSKWIEAVRAFQLERRLSKREILDAYLSFAPYGRNLEGVEAASWAMFGHSPESLTDDEIVTLLAIPQDPCGRYPSAENQDRLREARVRVAERLVREGVLVDSEAEAKALLDRISHGTQPSTLQPMPNEAPHAARWVRGRSGEDTDIVSSLDRGVQRSVEAILARARPELSRLGIHDASVVVVDHASAEIRALVGGFDFHGPRTGAQIPSFAVPRSPGSTLKPILLARAMDRGLALPQERVLDLPKRYGSYAPRNYGGEHRGTVRLDEALSLSLNIPYVDLLDRVGVSELLSVLRTLGMDSLHHDPQRYGLSLAVGGAEITPLELAGVYTALAREGRATPLRWKPAETGSLERGVEVLSPGAVALTLQILERRDRPDFPRRAAARSRDQPVAWKTGTSAAHRDAWAVGSDASHTVVVWLGNLDGSGSAHLVGGETAAPLLFDILEALASQATPTEWAAADPDALVAVRVCALSGLPAGPHCPHTLEVQAPRGAPQPRSCSLHVEVELDAVTGERLLPGCRDGRDTRREVLLVDPAALRRWRVERYGVVASFPPLAPDCRGLEAVPPPTIEQPQAGERVVLAEGVEPSAQEVPLAAHYALPGAELSWFVDGQFVGTAPADGEAWWVPEPGLHELVVVGSSGSGDRRWLEVVEG